MSASALPLKLCIFNYDRNISYQSLHTQSKRANPMQSLKYKHALLLHKNYNNSTNSTKWLDMFTNQSFNDQTVNANFLDLSIYKVGKKTLLATDSLS